MDRMVECELARIFINENSDPQYIFLREKAGERQFPIIIAITEAMAIDRFVREENVPRPQTHELLNDAIKQLGAHVIRVEVTKLENHTFYANLILDRDGETIELDARPSDAIALGVRNATPIFVHEDVLDEVTAT